MDSRRATLAIIVFMALLVLAWFFLAKGLLSLEAFRVAPPLPPQETERALVLTLTHRFAGDMHTYVGAVSLSTSCQVLSSSITASGGAARTALIVLRVEAVVAGTPCVRVNESQQFSVSLSSRETPTVTVTLDGSPVAVVVKEDGSL